MLIFHNFVDVPSINVFLCLLLARLPSIISGFQLIVEVRDVGKDDVVYVCV